MGGYLIDQRMKDATDLIDRLASNSMLRLAWKIYVGKKLAEAIERNQADVIEDVMREIREHLPAIATRKPSRRPPRPKPAKPGPGYHRERLDALRASMGLPVEPPRAWPWGPTRPYKHRTPAIGEASHRSREGG